MINKDTLIHPAGTLSLRVLDDSGVEVWSCTEHNLIVDTGYDLATQALAGVAGARIAKVAIGTSGAKPQSSDTQITDAAFINIQSIEYPKLSTVRFNCTIQYADAVGMSIREFGLCSADGRLFSRKVREPIEKTRHMSIVVVWEITF